MSVSDLESHSRNTFNPHAFHHVSSLPIFGSKRAIPQERPCRQGLSERDDVVQSFLIPLTCRIRYGPRTKLRIPNFAKIVFVVNFVKHLVGDFRNIGTRTHAQRLSIFRCDNSSERWTGPHRNDSNSSPVSPGHLGLRLKMLQLFELGGIRESPSASEDRCNLSRELEHQCRFLVAVELRQGLEQFVDAPYWVQATRGLGEQGTSDIRRRSSS